MSQERMRRILTAGGIALTLACHDASGVAIQIGRAETT